MKFMKTIPKLNPIVYISHSILVSLTIKTSFDFIINDLSKYYSDISKGHEYFKIKNGEKLQIGSIIDCSETAGNQSIMHEYHVNEISPNERIAYYSKPSLVKIKLPWKTIDSKSNTYVYYDFNEIEKDKTEIRLTIGVQFSSAFEKLFSQVFGGLIPWKKHCIEEMEGLKRILNEINK